MWAGEGLHWRAPEPELCREAGARVSTNVYVRDLDLPAPNVHDARRLEIIAEGLPIFGGAQFAIDTTLVQLTIVTEPPDRAPQPGMAQQWLRLITGRKPLTQSLWVREMEQSWLCWHWKLAAGGSTETVTCLTLLAAARARSESALMRHRVEQAWRMRWAGILGCAAARAFASSLLEQKPSIEALTV